jgi:FMN reductase
MRLLVVSCSLNPASRSAQLAELALADWQAAGHEAEMLALEDFALPLCDGDHAYNHAGVVALAEKIRAARGLLLAVPVYNYDVNAAAKNLVELTGEAWTGKVIGFLCAAGGPGSYMSVMPFANSLMLDFRCVVVPRFVYATASDFADEQLESDGVAAFAGALDQLTDPPRP